MDCNNSLFENTEFNFLPRLAKKTSVDSVLNSWWKTLFAPNPWRSRHSNPEIDHFNGEMLSQVIEFNTCKIIIATTQPCIHNYHMTTKVKHDNQYSEDLNILCEFLKKWKTKAYLRTIDRILNAIFTRKISKLTLQLEYFPKRVVRSYTRIFVSNI